MASCTNHPVAPAEATCAGCNRPFCGSCLVSFLGRQHCGACRDAQVARMQGVGGIVYTPARRFRNSSVISLCRLGLFLLPAAPALIIALLLPERLAWLKWVVGGIGLTLGFVLPSLAMRRLFLLGNQELRSDIGRKIATLGVGEAVAHGRFVGLAPRAERSAYDGETDWDVGFLLVRPGWLAYYGDRCWFCLRPDQVTSLDVIPKKPSPGPESRLLVNWRDAETGRTGVASFTTRDIRVRSELRPSVEALQAELQAWRGMQVPVEPSAMPLPPEAPKSSPGSVLAGTEPGGWMVQLAVGIPLAIVAALLSVTVKITTGAEIPMPITVPSVIILSAVIAQAIINRRKARNPPD